MEYFSKYDGDSIVVTGTEIIPTGWVCPKCGRVYSPITTMCLYCDDDKTTITTNTTGTDYAKKQY